MRLTDTNVLASKRQPDISHLLYDNLNYDNYDGTLHVCIINREDSHITEFNVRFINEDMSTYLRRILDVLDLDISKEIKLDAIREYFYRCFCVKLLEEVHDIISVNVTYK